MSSNNQEHNFFLLQQYSSIENFVKEYKKTYSGKKNAKELYLLLINELKKAVTEGDLETLHKLNQTFNYISSVENWDSLKSYDITNNPTKRTNLVILACKFNKPHILKFLLANDVLNNLSVNAGENAIVPDDEDETCHNSFYYALCSGNIKLIDTLIDNWPNNYFDVHEVELDDILSKAYEELKLKNVPLSSEVEVFVETKLLNLRFYSNSSKQKNASKDYLHNIRERARLVLDNISLLRTEYLQPKEIDERFLYIAKFIAQNVHVLKRRLKSTYDRLPWEEIEFCLVSFVSSQIKEQEMNLFYNALLNRSKILNYLQLFSKELEEIMENEDIGKFTDLPKLKREKVVAEIVRNNPQFEDLYKTYQQIRDIHSLQKINDYIKLASSVDSKEREGQLIITRVLQVIGEYLKNTFESPKLSDATNALLMLLLPKNTREIIIDLRNSLSHAFSLNKRTEIEDSKDVGFFMGIQNDTKKIGSAVTDILHKHKMKIIRMLLKQIFNSESLDEMKEVTKNFSKLKLDQINPDSYKMLEHKELKKLIEELDNIVPQKTYNVQYLFHKINTILKDFEKKNINIKMDYAMGFASLKSFVFTLNDDKTDSYFITGMKCRAHQILEEITPKLDPDYLKEIAELTRIIFNSVKTKLQQNELEILYRIMWEIFCIIEFEIGNIKWIEELREKINEKCFFIPAYKQNVMTQENYDTQLQVKLAELKSILNNYLLGNKLIQNYTSYKGNKQLQALIEMLVLDIMSILGCSKNYLENNFLLFDSNTPLLTGKYLRNHLAHYNDLVDLLLSDPSIAVILNANKLTSENIIKSNKKIGKPVTDNPSKLELKFNKDLFTIANQERMFVFLQEGNLEGYERSLSEGADINGRNINLWTSMHFAAKGPNLEILKLIADRNVNINVKDVNDQTPLHIAATYGRRSIVDFFIKMGLNTEDVDIYGKTALHLAAQNGHEDTVMALLQNKASAFVLDVAGLSPLYYAVRNDYIEVVKILLEKDINVDIYEAMGGFTPLHEAAEGGHLEIINFLLKKGANVNAKNDRNWTPLHAASRNGYPEVVNILVLKGADVNARVINGCTSLYYAAETGHEDVVNILLKNGADINVSDETGTIPLHGAVKHGHKNICKILLNKENASTSNNEGMTSLHFAAHNGHFEIVVALLTCSVDAKVKNKADFTPLHCAAERGHVKIADLLMKHGIMVNVKTSTGFTALHLAALKGHQDMINLLIENGADIDAKEKEGFTPLHLIIAQNNTNIINVLLKSKANINARSTNGFTPLHLAVLSGKKDIVIFLLKRNAKVNSKSAINLTPLHTAVLYGHKDIVKVLIQNKADVNATDNMHIAPLHIAVESGHKDIVTILIANGASINIKTKNNQNPIMLAVTHRQVEMVEIFINAVDVNVEGKEPLLAAVYAGFTDVLEIFLKHGADINAKYENMTLLHIAAFKGHKEIVSRLITKGADLGALSFHKETPLYIAAKEGYIEIVKIMLEKGASVDVINHEGFTPLHIAAANGHVDVVKLLLEKNKRNLNLKDNENRTTIELAVAYGHLQVVKTLLENKEININSKGNDEYTILHIAAQENKLDIVKFLLDKGAYINSENSSGTKPIHIAAREGHKNIVEIFLSKGCSINDLGASNQNLLHYAAMKGHLELLTYLIAQGADVNAADTNMLRPIHIAAYFGYNDIIRVLLKNGAYYNAVDKNNKKPINVTNKNDTKSLLASTEKFFDAVKSNSVLEVKNHIKAGAYINSTDVQGVIPLHYAAWKGYNEIVLVLLQNKADVNGVNNKGYVPLHYAAKFSHLQVVKTLLCNGAVYNAVSDSGKTPLDVTVDKNIAILLKLVNESFKNVENENSKVISTLNKINDIDTVKAVMKACNIDNRSLVVAAMHSNFEKVEELKGILQGDVSSKINAALIMLNQNNYQGSLCIFKNIFEKRKDILGSDNPGSLDIQTHIAKVLFQQGDYKKALSILKEIFLKQKDMLGLNDKNTLSTRSTIALVLHTEGRDNEALDIYQDVYMWQKRLLGQSHTDTLETQLHMALVLDRLEKYEEALSMNQEVYKKRKESNHPAALLAQNNVALVLSHQQNYEEALRIYNKVLEKKKVLFGMNHSNTLRTLHNIAGVLFNQKKYYEALKAYEEVLNMRKKTLGPYHPDTLITQYGIGTVLFTQSKWNSALKAYKEGFEQRIAIFGSSHPTVLDILDKLELIKFNIKMEGDKISVNLDHVQTDIYGAANIGDIQMLQKLLKSGAGINNKDTDKRTALHYAVNIGHIGTIIMLLKNGADATLVTEKGNTPLHIATSKGYKEAVEILLQNINCDKLNDFINAQTFAGHTAALHVAAKNGFLHIVTLLLKYGATYNIKNKEGKTPVDLSKDQNIISLLKLVEELFEDTKTGNDKIIKKLKILKQDELKAVTNARNSNLNTLLQVSITNKHKNISREILEALKQIG